LSDEETPELTPDDSAPAEPEATEPQAEATEPEATEPEADAADTPAEEPVASEEPAAPEEPAPAEEPAAPEEPAPAEEPVAAEEPAAEAAEPGAAGDQPAAEEPAPAEEPAAEAPPAPAPTAAGGEEEAEELPETPRVKPEIPGLELEPDIAPEGEQYLDAEARAAAEAEAEAAAARARAEDEDEGSRPIADAAIDLAAGARYTATGKRKTAVARVILRPGNGEYSINGKGLDVFFPRETLQRMIRQPLESVGYESRMDVVARMHGGGVSAQAGALRHGISRALIEADPNLRGELKRRGFLTRDPRVKERKKAGLKKARKRPQFSKR
jgi:small subunit ribosomal protein S9